MGHLRIILGYVPTLIAHSSTTPNSTSVHAIGTSHIPPIDLAFSPLRPACGEVAPHVVAYSISPHAHTGRRLNGRRLCKASAAHKAEWSCQSCWSCQSRHGQHY